MARKKRRFEQLEAAAAAPEEKKKYNDPLKIKVNNRLEEVGKNFEGKGKTLMYALAALVLLGLLGFIFTKWNRNASGAAQAELGKAIKISQSQISETGPAPGSTERTFKTEKERSEAAIAEFQSVASKFGGDAAEKAKYFIAVNKLNVDRAAGVQELEAIAGSSSETGKLAKFALAQTRVGDNRLDDAANLFRELAGMSDAVIAKDTINFELAKVLEKQGKPQEAAEIYFNIAKTASEAKDADGKAIRLTETATEAKDKLKELDPERAKQIVDTPADS
jgi:predicted negative regulator of RcsB-dependent stress response